MHILIVALHRPTKPTGICRHAANLAKCLADLDQVHRITIIIGEWQIAYFKATFVLDSPKINLISIAITNSSLSRNIWFILGLSKIAKKLCPDIIHLSFPIPFFRQLLKQPVVTTIHDLYPYEFPENFGYPNVLFNRLFLTYCIRNSNGLSCVSNITLNSLYKYFPKANLNKEIAVVYNYVDFIKIKTSIPEGKNIQNLDQFLLCIGQHRQNKNLDLLIKTFFNLKIDGTLKQHTKLIIVGSNGPETPKLYNLVDYFNIEKSVLFLSSIEDSNLKWLYQNCEIFIIPSSTEGFCLPLAEAMSFSSKIVCSDIPIFREIGGDDCIYFQLTQNSEISQKNLAKAINYSLKKVVSRKTITSCHFSKATVAIQYLELYSKILSTNFPVVSPNIS